MSTDVTMQDLELETAELLPSRETLWSGGGYSSYHSFSQSNFGFGNANQVAVGGSGNGDGSFLPILNGAAININVL
jgi:hypothetical protein